MKDLLKSKDILKEDRVIEAYWGLIGTPVRVIPHMKDVSGGSMADVAFVMRDACIAADIAGQPNDWYGHLIDITGHEDGYNVMLSDPKQWICAAVKVWEERE